jgi:hypothetical protein
MKYNKFGKRQNHALPDVKAEAGMPDRQTRRAAASE